ERRDDRRPAGNAPRADKPRGEGQAQGQQRRKPAGNKPNGNGQRRWG
ncbi:MAG: hypothetical protein GXC70_10880, partial [Sphingomonadaceae bacterium]|nr:hypothetical protein [Sphingomonadaceae bacterium]